MPISSTRIVDASIRNPRTWTAAFSVSRLPLVVTALLLAGCGDSAGGGGAGGQASAGCPDDQVELTYFEGDDTRTECAAIPDVCNGTASCEETACIAEMYGLCEAGFIAAGCSDMFKPTIISCNES